MLRLFRNAASVSAFCFVCAHSAELERKPVSSVSTVGGPATIALETRAGEPLDPGKLQHDVKALWASGRVSDVRVEAIDQGPTVRVVFRMKEKQTLRLRNVQVNPPTPELDRSLNLPPRSPIDAQRAQEVAARIRTHLESTGFPNATVEARLVAAGPGLMDLRVNIDKGQHFKIKEVTLSGDTGVQPSTALRALRHTKRLTILPGIPGIWNGFGILPDYSQDRVQNDVAGMQSFYYKRGYFDAAVRLNSTDFRGDGAHVELGVQAGPLYAIREFNLRDAEGTREIPIGPDGAFSSQRACSMLLAERRKAERAGVLDFTASIEVREVAKPEGALADGRKWANLTAIVERGSPYRVGRIEFRGLHAFSDLTVRRMLLNKEGDLLDQMLLRKTLDRINRTGMFEPLTETSAVINTPPRSDTADITIFLKEKKSRHWYMSGPVGPLSFAGPLQLAIGSRLPAWGQGVLELSTYTVSMNLMLFAKPLSTILPMLPNRRFIPELLIRRPLLPGQNFLSGFVIAPQFGWQGALVGYGISHMRDSLGGLLGSDRPYITDLPVAIVHPGVEGREMMYCQAPKTKADWAKQIGGTASTLVFSFLPF
jgi:outer membrane protein assembly factor BamA